MIRRRMTNSLYFRTIMILPQWLYHWVHYTKHHHMSLIILFWLRFLPKWTYLSILFILETACTEDSAGLLNSKWYVQIRHPRWKRWMQNEIRLIWWRLVYWTEWYHFCGNITDMDGMRWMFRPLFWYLIALVKFSHPTHVNVGWLQLPPKLVITMYFAVWRQGQEHYPILAESVDIGGALFWAI